jgi:hypothetical protein
MQSKIVFLLIVAFFATMKACNASPSSSHAGSHSATAPVVKNQAVKTDYVKFTKLPPGKALALHQRCLILGDFDVLISATGLNATCKRSGITFISRPPLWNPVGYSLFSRSVWKPQRATFAPIDDMCKALPILGLPNIWLIPVVHIGKKVVSGFNCESFATTAAWHKEQVKQFDQGLIRRTSPHSAKYDGADIGLPKAVCQNLEHVYGVPSCSLLPINFTYDKFSGAVGKGLETDSCEIVTAPKNWLDVPAGYKTVKTFNELNMDKGAQAGAEDLFGH